MRDSKYTASQGQDVYKRQHEVMHPALQHHVRRSGRDPRRWNEACDYVINPLLLDAGLSLPDGVLVDHRFRSMSAEQIYNLRNTEACLLYTSILTR